MFTCPRCSIPLSALRRQGTCVWGCAQCSGRLATVAALRRVFDAQAISAIWQSARTRDAHGGVTCPGCRRAMCAGAARFGGELSEVDACPSCLFVWLDADEYARVPRPAPPRVESQLSPNARAAAARLEVGLQREQSWLDGASARPDSVWKTFLGTLGLPVEVEERGTGALPWVTWLLALACVVASLYVWQFGAETAAPAALDGFARGRVLFRGIGVFGRVFAHGDVFQLVLNVYFLLAFGGRAEETRGRAGWLFLFACSAAAGAVAYALASSQPADVALGARAAVAGLLAWYALAFPRVRISWALFAPRWSSPGPVQPVWFNVSALWALPFFAALQAFDAFMWSGTAAFVACGAGGAAGALIWFAADRRWTRDA